MNVILSKVKDLKRKIKILHYVQNDTLGDIDKLKLSSVILSEAKDLKTKIKILHYVQNDTLKDIDKLKIVFSAGMNPCPTIVKS